MTQRNRTPRRSSVIDAETGSDARQVPAQPHDSGSQANETVDGLDANAESLRHAAEDTPSGSGPGDIGKTAVFDRAGAAAHIWWQKHNRARNEPASACPTVAALLR